MRLGVSLGMSSRKRGSGAAANPNPMESWWYPSAVGGVDAPDNQFVAGTRLTFANDGKVHSIAFYRPAGNATTGKVGLYEILTDATGTLLVEKSYTGAVDGWNVVQLDTPIDVLAAKAYIPVWLSDVNGSSQVIVRYHNDHLVTQRTSSGGNIVVPPAGTATLGATGQGRYTYSSVMTYPLTKDTSDTYYVDLVYQRNP